MKLKSIALACASFLLTNHLWGQTMPTTSIPASLESAQQALQASPRHGEWVDVPLQGSEKPIRAWVVHPESPDRRPVVIVIHEIFGLTDWVRAVADQLAAEGYVAIAPDLLSGKGENGGGTESFAGDSVREAIRKLTPDEVVQRLNAVRDFSATLPSARGETGVIGFCWGGSSSFMYATRQPELKAAVVYYGSAPTDKEALAKITAPVLGIYGQDDARVTSTIEPTQKAMAEVNKPYIAKIYDRAGHGFLRQQSGKEGANLEASKRAWAETIQFFRTHLPYKEVSKPAE